MKIYGIFWQKGPEGRHEVVRGLQVQEVNAQATEILRPFLAVQMNDVGVGFPDILTGKVQEHAFASFRIFQDDA
ncbi:MAG TPA: hypothetical protein PK077_08640, partial [Akkermansia muciniphila]|nr:hypothetical protein [Akkermansia muciniphila]